MKNHFELGGIPNLQNTKQSQEHLIPPIFVEKFTTKLHTFCAINWHGKSQIKFYIDYVPTKSK